jgi:hypothetical protein
MRCVPGLFAFAALTLICAAPAYSVQLLYQTMKISAPGVISGPGMDGPSEPTASAGTGYGTALYDNVAHTLKLDCTFSGLDPVNNTGVTASHIHSETLLPFQGTAGVATTTPTFAGFPAGVLAGEYHNTLDLTLASSWNPAYVTAKGGIAQAEAAFTASLAAGTAYWNIHSQKYGSGEIRGFMQLVPEPASCLLFCLGFVWFTSFARPRS